MADDLDDDYYEWRKTWQEIGAEYARYQESGLGRELAAWMAYDKVVLAALGVRPIEEKCPKG